MPPVQILGKRAPLSHRDRRPCVAQSLMACTAASVEHFVDGKNASLSQLELSSLQVTDQLAVDAGQRLGGGCRRVGGRQ